MSTLTRLARTFVRDEEGATTAEYGIIIVVVAGIAIFVLSQLNGALNTLYGNFSNKVTTGHLSGRSREVGRAPRGSSCGSFRHAPQSV